jgi:hypothetical protein
MNIIGVKNATKTDMIVNISNGIRKEITSGSNEDRDFKLQRRR